MNKNHQEYELNILKKVINEHLDKSIPVTEEGLNHLLSHHDNTIWNITTKIYSQSGYKVEFTFIRDVVNSWIEVLKKRIAAEKATAYKRLQLPKIEQAKQSEIARIEKAKLAELSRISISDLFLKVKPMISEAFRLELDKVTLITPIKNFKWSWSGEGNAEDLYFCELIMEIEEKFDIEIPDEDADRLSTVGELLEYIHQNLSNKYV
ncbi:MULTISPECIES: acyl carrier protein [unclassified Nodularia (in: cyanobacteria)]|uniref:acyl carrier protein n=1 Tax=unclassified Nodularia (in: cyanobacteria) TaxID=2656917 RepID=UPI001880B36D|nr:MULTISPECIES: acyl carrier protein [unclassified Nodularia (in: cyanobacteria)]MBE9201499.1 acyl carrier protein [Nodularia sp. LEGE 06071]MCC2691417.1 acyl carrier protein [Nodularia sp. LEGE 04288]